MGNLRRSQRKECAVPVEGKEGTVFDRTQAVDFSKGGLGFISKHRIPKNKEIPIELELTPGGDPVFVVGKVTWVQKIKGSDYYRIGLSFTEVLHGSKSRLSRYFTQNKTE